MANTPENHQPTAAEGANYPAPKAAQSPHQADVSTQATTPLADMPAHQPAPIQQPQAAAPQPPAAAPQPQAEQQPTNYPQPAAHGYGMPAGPNTYQQPQPQPQPGQGAFGLAAAGNDGAGYNGGNSNGGGNGGSSNGNAPQTPQSKGRTGMLLAGLAIGALLGGVVGGGVAAVVSANGNQQVVSQSPSGSLTLNNAETATAISGVAAVATPSVVTLQVTGASAGGSGSGVIYSEDGYIITNAHVVTLDGAAGDSATIRVKLSDGRILDGDLVGVDPYADLAVVKVDAEGLPAIKVADSSALNVGDLTVAIGAPLNLANTVTSGVVSSLYRGISVGSPLIPQDPTTPQDGNGQQGDGGQGGDGGFPWDFRFGLPDQGQGGEQQQQQSAGGTVTLPVIQTDASINPGNSGGALLNGKGELIGINVAIASPASSNGVAGSAGLGFAIPSNLAARVADALIAGEQPSHGLLGASVADSTQDTDADANHAGGLLVDVMKGGAAQKAGLRAGDVITAVNGVPAVDGTSVSALVRMNAGGSTISIDYTRDGKAAQTEATLGTLEW